MAPSRRDDYRSVSPACAAAFASLAHLMARQAARDFVHSGAAMSMGTCGSPAHIPQPWALSTSTAT
jgi:hypothetical protein